MTLPSIEATSDEARKLLNLARMFTHSATFQALCGVSDEQDSPAAAEAYVWIDKDDPDGDGNYTYPALVLFSEQTMASLEAEPPQYHVDTMLTGILVAKTPSGAEGDPGDYRANGGDLAIWWSNTLDNIRSEVLDQSGEHLRLSIRSFMMQRAGRSDFSEREEYGDLVDRLFRIETTH